MITQSSPMPPLSARANLEQEAWEFDTWANARQGDRQFASTLAHGLQILRCFTPFIPVWGNAELADRIGLSRPTITRYTSTLCRLGYLRTDDATGKYRLGSAVLGLSYGIMTSIPIRQIIRPLMDELARSINGSVSMGVRDRLSMLYVETCRSDPRVTVQHSDVGMRMPILTTAMGRAYLASCHESVRQSILRDMREHTPMQWARHQDSLPQVLHEYAQQGFCTNYGEQHPDFFAVGVPLGRPVQGESLIFNCVIPINRMSRGHLKQHIGPRLVAMVEQLRFLPC